jgi:hypothetical protein
LTASTVFHPRLDGALLYAWVGLQLWLPVVYYAS